jgi:glycosyltransferase involved in cell wall biosynthesis
MQQPLVTVYVVNHNYGRFIERAVDSVLQQTMQNFELIIIDDGSSDGSQEIIERYAEYDKIQIILQHNKGLNVTNNIAMRTASGKYIVRLDADDYFDDNALQILSSALERHPDVGLVFPDYFEVDVDGNIQEMVRRHNFDEVTVFDQPAHGACTMIRMECLKELGGYDEEHSCQDGFDLWVRLIGKHKVKNVNLPLFYYRQHGASLTRNEERLLTTRNRILEKTQEIRTGDLVSVALIPIRGVTTDPHSLALQELGSKLVMDWTIDSALQAESVDHVLVTTPDDDIINHVELRYGRNVICIRRPVKLALVNSFLSETIRHALDACENNLDLLPDVIAMLHVESPFRLPRHIDSAVNSLILFETDSLVAVRPDHDTFFQHNGNGLQRLTSSEALRLEGDGLFRVVGDMQITRTSFFQKTGKNIGGRVGHITMDEKHCHSILSQWDWEMAKLLADRYYAD